MKPKQEKRELRRLYALIPTFKCIEGCSSCCGPVPASREERKRGPALLDTGSIRTAELADDFLFGGDPIEWANNCIRCPYVVENGGGCAIYEDRPFLCRLFGNVPSMPCPLGAGPEKMLSSAEESRLMHDYLKICASPGKTAACGH